MKTATEMRCMVSNIVTSADFQSIVDRVVNETLKRAEEQAKKGKTYALICFYPAYNTFAYEDHFELLEKEVMRKLHSLGYKDYQHPRENGAFISWE